MTYDDARAHVEGLLTELTGTAQSPTSGDLEVLLNETRCFVRVHGPQDAPLAHVYAIAVDQVARSPELSDALNDANAVLVYAKAFWERDQVIVQVTHLASALDAATLERSLHDVAGAAEFYGPRIAEQFGGRSTNR